MEVLLAIAAFLGALVGVLTLGFQVIGIERIRRWVRLEEPEPYYVSSTSGRDFENDTVVAALVKLEHEAGNQTSWQAAHLAPARLNEGFEYLRTNHRKIVHRSKTYAHGDEVVLMVKHKH